RVAVDPVQVEAGGADGRGDDRLLEAGHVGQAAGAIDIALLDRGGDEVWRLGVDDDRLREAGQGDAVDVLDRAGRDLEGVGDVQAGRRGLQIPGHLVVVVHRVPGGGQAVERDLGTG